MRSLQASVCEDKGLGESWEGLPGKGLVESDMESSVALGAREGLLLPWVSWFLRCTRKTKWFKIRQKRRN